MSVILCATRGGEASNRTQDKAIEIAKERGHTLLFLYVVDIHFLDKMAAPIVVDVEEELLHMGEFLLLMAKERAAAQDVEAETVCRKGVLRQEIKELAQQEEVKVVVLGQPTGAYSAFELADLTNFAEEIERETGTEAVIV